MLLVQAKELCLSDASFRNASMCFVYKADQEIVRSYFWALLQSSRITREAKFC